MTGNSFQNFYIKSSTYRIFIELVFGLSVSNIWHLNLVSIKINLQNRKPSSVVEWSHMPWVGVWSKLLSENVTPLTSTSKLWVLRFLIDAFYQFVMPIESVTWYWPSQMSANYCPLYGYIYSGRHFTVCVVCVLFQSHNHSHSHTATATVPHVTFLFSLMKTAAPFNQLNDSKMLLCK